MSGPSGNGHRRFRRNKAATPGEQLLERVAGAPRAVRARGVAESGRLAWEFARTFLALDESHVWFELEPQAARPRPPLATGLVLRLGTRSDVPLLARFATIPAHVAERRLAAGHDLWLVTEHDEPRFACWILHRSFGRLAASGGVMTVPPGTVCLEDSVTAAQARGRGVAPAAWAAIADRLAQEGIERVLTPVEPDNTATQRALAKAGFAERCTTHNHRDALHARVTVDAPDHDALEFYAEALGLGEGRAQQSGNGSTTAIFSARRRLLPR